MNSLKALHRLGQSIWLDYIRRSFLTTGELNRLVREDAVSGVTANPTIFEKAIAGSDDYDETLRSLTARDRHADPKALYEALAIEDIRRAADTLQRVYEHTSGADGFVSLEVAPALAHDTDGTIAEARRLWQTVRRSNLMIKVPATVEGLPAIEQLIADGINVNVTLMFSLRHYEAVAAAYLHGLGRAKTPQSVASVASFFVSRVDAAVDRALEDLNSPSARPLLGKTAVANAKRAYRRYRELFHGRDFAALAARGARPQRVLWASTSTKNPAYSNVKYVEELIGPETVNTMPPATLSAFRDHGQPRLTLEEGLDEADQHIEALSELGIDLESIADRLLVNGVQQFADSFTSLMHTLGRKRANLQHEQSTSATYRLGEMQNAVRTRLANWQVRRVGRRIWDRDPTVWGDAETPELTDRLGWLDLPEKTHEELSELRSVGEAIRENGITNIVLVGMGGSSLAPEVFAQALGSAPGYPTLTMLDSTHPDAVIQAVREVDAQHTLVIVSSKSGTTLETLSLFKTFWKRIDEAVSQPGRHFVAITDPGTPLEHLAHDRQFRRVFRAPPDVGGRYSALSVFGVVPASLIGADVHGLIDRAWTMAEASSFCIGDEANPSLVLGATLGELTLAGRDKVTFLTTPRLAAFPAWLEQLIAESTGKHNIGIIPVADEAIDAPDRYASDRFFVAVTLDEEPRAELDRALDALAAAGHPVMYTRLRDVVDLGQEMFRWELAVAAAGAVLGINPFDQPDVQLAKDLARNAMRGGDQGLESEVGETLHIASGTGLRSHLNGWLESANERDYIAIQAYLAPGSEMTKRLQMLRHRLREKRALATTVGYGPRFLHSTGQLHKGGPNTGLFLQLVDEPSQDLAVPETDYTFGTLIRAQALGDYSALSQRERRVLRVNLGKDPASAITQLTDALDS